MDEQPLGEEKMKGRKVKNLDAPVKPEPTKPTKTDPVAKAMTKPVKPEAKKEVKPAKPAKEKAVKVPKTLKAKLKVSPPKGVTVKETKFLTVASIDKKRIWVRGSAVGLTEKLSGIKGFKYVTAEEAKKSHLGKTRMLGKVSTQAELDDIVKRFFA